MISRFNLVVLGLLLSLYCSSGRGQNDFSVEKIVPNSAYFSSDNDNFQYSGRIDFSSKGKAVFSMPAVKIMARFTGPEITVYLKDLTSGSNQADGTPAQNFFNVYIDDQKPFVLGLSPNDSIYLLASGLVGNEHTVTLVKRTESLAGKVEFRGFWLKKGHSLVVLPEKPVRKIEFIGNSITCGYGVEAASENDHFGCASENVCLSFASLTGEALQADYHIVAYSGRGVVQNYGCTPENTLPVIWNEIFPDQDEPAWDHQLFVPDVTVINLGTNDFNCSELDTSLFRAEYKNFLAAIRWAYPESQIVCVVGPMLSDDYPVNSLSTIRYLIQSILEQTKRNGDEKLYYFEMSSQNGELGYGADWHPSIAQQQKNADELTDFLTSITGWKTE